VNCFSVSADAALEGKPTAATRAESLENEKTTLKPKDGTAEPIKAKKPIANPKIGAGMV